jgi:hypothetical protein
MPTLFPTEVRVCGTCHAVVCSSRRVSPVRWSGMILVGRTASGSTCAGGGADGDENEVDDADDFDEILASRYGPPCLRLGLPTSPYNSAPGSAPVGSRPL